MKLLVEKFLNGDVYKDMVRIPEELRIDEQGRQIKSPRSRAGFRWMIRKASRQFTFPGPRDEVRRQMPDARGQSLVA